ncbi:DNA oxidative demethylase AlkB [Bordetella holmesii]|uniref:2OG-Fe(II) oxygenase superfamily protein n=2 Tax=Bordetella holmesii TaxID=35814 RepID=A0ABN0S3T6_9BORD|nr:DNA oxidative demethylase AlkB [Bordetella holmesii]AHV93777.1 2OG-Fe(II) oxygenase superfamily protein [Bordetella holmesii ATCC 51541]AIT26350.1 2OG-Fe(II) oxygenase superfamily protein [Bordetella holmesii 44057]EWM42990.1 2OG-Fe(II) oxygenase superfamily protein [Bordetella holmesii 41130]EWM46924.1 2OG-Fe(II) oxygenase superfamily protein [Bordetella holmesii 35009]EWM51099.1 2OG-Fe(II) oxygenase superfamily protein [Bordetella holmesii 70147]
MQTDLFADDHRIALGPQACLLRGWALPQAEAILAALTAIEANAPPRQMVTPGGLSMSVSMTNCGALGWTSDRQGYHYRRLDPQSGKPWPPMPALLAQLASEAAAQAGFAAFRADACLINHYTPGARMSLHQDRNEQDFAAPIVSVSLGLPAIFLFGGLRRDDRSARIVLQHGDVAVWGGVDRLRFHGVLPLADGRHPMVGRQRINLTLRHAGRPVK